MILVPIWIGGLLLIAMEIFGLYLLARIAGKKLFMLTLLCPALVWWITSEQAAFERALSSIFFPWTLVTLLLDALHPNYWPTILTALIIFGISWITFPKTSKAKALWFVLVAGLMFEMPFWAQNAWSQSQAAKRADIQQIQIVTIPHFRDALRNRLGNRRNWLNNSNGQGNKDGQLYLWSYRKADWYRYDPD